MGSREYLQNDLIPYKDCTQGICSLYCPQWCYGGTLFPPPSLPLQFDDGSASSSGPNFSPLIIAIIGVLGSAFLLVTYYAIISKFCKRSDVSGAQDQARDTNLQGSDGSPSPDAGLEPWYLSNGGLDEALIRSIAVCKYKRGSGMLEATCSVCLSEFEEDESVRLLPKCTHAFHVPCIDTWLRSHSNCPLCRSEVAFTSSFPVLMPQLPPTEQLPGNESRRETENRTGSAPTSSSNNNTTRDQEEVTRIGSHAAKSQSMRIFHNIGNPGRTADTVIEMRCEELQPIRRSFSAGHSCQTVADILKVDQDHEENQIQESTSSSVNDHQGNAGLVKITTSEMCEVGHRGSFLHCVIDLPAPMKRSFSSEWLSQSRHVRTKGIRIPV